MDNSRRSFIKKTAFVASSTLILPSLASAAVKNANSLFNVAIVGVGGRGDAAVQAFMNCPQVRVVAFCDVDDVVAKKITTHSHAYQDFATTA